MTVLPPQPNNNGPSEADQELLSAYLDDMLSDAERVELETRLANEPVLRQTLEELHTTVLLLNDMPQLVPPRSFTLDPTQVEPRRTGFLNLGWLTNPFGAVGALAVALIAVVLTSALVSGVGMGSQPADFAQQSVADTAELPMPSIIAEAAPAEEVPEEDFATGADAEDEAPPLEAADTFAEEAVEQAESLGEDELAEAESEPLAEEPAAEADAENAPLDEAEDYAGDAPAAAAPPLPAATAPPALAATSAATPPAPLSAIGGGNIEATATGEGSSTASLMSEPTNEEAAASDRPAAAADREDDAPSAPVGNQTGSNTTTLFIVALIAVAAGVTAGWYFWQRQRR